MASLVIKINMRHGRLAEFVRTTGEKVSVGRGLANDIVLPDLYVAPDQIRLYRVESQWKIDVLDHTNPVLINGKPVTGDEEVVNSGDKITIGRTRLTVYTEDHPVEATHKLVLSNWMNRGMFRLILPVLTLAVVSLLSVFTEYQGLATTLKWGKLASNALIAIFVILCWAGLWALIGRLLRHQPQFLMQLLFSGLIASVLIIGSPISDYLEYAGNSVVLGNLFTWGFLLFICTALLKFNLAHASNLHNTTVIALVFSVCLLLFFFGVYSFNKDDFANYPQYSHVLKPPFAKLTRNQTINEYLQDYKMQFRDLDEELEK